LPFIQNSAAGNLQAGFFVLPGPQGKTQSLTKGGEVIVATVVLRSNESQDQLLKRFRKKVVKSGVLSTVRRKRWFVSKSELRRVEKKKAIRRLRRRQYPSHE
jgi:small subunit ribosomal protein S21